jgi:hypothetical protein
MEKAEQREGLISYGWISLTKVFVKKFDHLTGKQMLLRRAIKKNEGLKWSLVLITILSPNDVALYEDNEGSHFVYRIDQVLEDGDNKVKKGEVDKFGWNDEDHFKDLALTDRRWIYFNDSPDGNSKRVGHGQDYDGMWVMTVPPRNANSPHDFFKRFGQMGWHTTEVSQLATPHQPRTLLFFRNGPPFNKEFVHEIFEPPPEAEATEAVEAVEEVEEAKSIEAVEAVEEVGASAKKLSVATVEELQTKINSIEAGDTQDPQVVRVAREAQKAAKKANRKAKNKRQKERQKAKKRETKNKEEKQGVDKKTKQQEHDEKVENARLNTINKMELLLKGRGGRRKKRKATKRRKTKRKSRKRKTKLRRKSRKRKTRKRR